MIYIDRSSAEIPEILIKNNSSSNGEKHRSIRFFEFNEGEPVDFSIYGHSLVKQALIDLFKGKCAYCESSIVAVSYPHIEHWRPKKGIKEAEDHLGYYWLASEWTNLFLACSQCNGQKYKGNHFPLEIGSEYARKSTDDINTLEKPLLLNPCIDAPKNHINYTQQGIIHSLSLKGKVSITIYGLDRANLTIERAKYAHIIMNSLNRIVILIDETANLLAQGVSKSHLHPFVKLVDEFVEDLKIYTNSNFQYSGMSKYLIEKFREEKQENKIFLDKTKVLVE